MSKTFYNIQNFVYFYAIYELSKIRFDKFKIMFMNSWMLFIYLLTFYFYANYLYIKLKIFDIKFY